MNLSVQQAALAWASGKRVLAKEVTDYVFQSVEPVGSDDGAWTPRVFGGTSGMYEFRLAPGETMEKQQADKGRPNMDAIAFEALKCILSRMAPSEPWITPVIASEAYDLAAAMIEESRRRKG